MNTKIKAIFQVKIAYEDGTRNVEVEADNLEEAWVTVAHRAANMGSHHTQSINLVMHAKVEEKAKRHEAQTIDNSLFAVW